MSKNPNTASTASTTTSPRKPSLMTGLALAGQQYFDTPYNIPSTFGEFYVGSPTAVMSDFVPMPLDFMQEQGEQAQQNYDAALLLAQTKPEQFKQLIQAAPFNQETRDLLIKEYGLDVKPEQWAKELVYNPAAAQKIATDISALGERFKADPRTTSIADEYTRWTEKIMNEPYQTGWANFRDPITGAFKQLDPSKVKAEFVVDDHMEYWNKQYQPKFVARVLESIRTTGDGTETLEDISFSDPRIQRAIEGIAYEMMMDPNPQTSRIMRETMSFGENFDRWKQFVSDQVAEQMYTKKTLDLSEVGTGTTTTPAPSPVNPINDLVYQSEFGAGNTVTVFDSDVINQNIKNGRESLQVLNSGFNQFMSDLLTDPTQRKFISEAFDYKDASGNSITSIFKETLKNKKGFEAVYNQIKDWGSGELLASFFSIPKERFKTNFNFTEEEYKEIQSSIDAGLITYSATAPNENRGIVDEIWAERAKAKNLENQISQNEAFLQNITDETLRLSSTDSEVTKLRRNAHPKLEEVIKQFGIKEVQNALGKIGKGPMEAVIEGSATFDSPIMKALVNAGVVTEVPYKIYDKGYVKEVKKSYQETPGYNNDEYTTKLTNKQNEYLANNQIKMNRTKVEAQKTEATKDLTIRNLPETIASNLTNSEILYALQTDAITGEGGKSIYSDMSLEEIINKKNPDFDFENMEGKPTMIIIDNPAVGKPRRGFVFKDNKGNEVILEAGWGSMTPTDQAKMAFEMMSEQEPKDRAVGARWISQLAIDNTDATKLYSFYSPSTKLGNNLEMIISAGSNKYVMSTVVKGTGSARRTYKELHREVNGQKVPLTYKGVNAQGSPITFNNITNPSEAFEIIGYDLVYGTTGGPGGSSIGGKPQLGAKK